MRSRCDIGQLTYHKFGEILTNGLQDIMLTSF